MWTQTRDVKGISKSELCSDLEGTPIVAWLTQLQYHCSKSEEKKNLLTNQEASFIQLTNDNVGHSVLLLADCV